jgi:hypothetical protein
MRTPTLEFSKGTIMKSFKLAPIAGMLLASSSSFAYTVPTTDITIYAAGASAQLNSISGILTSLCVANATTGTITPGVNQIQYFQGYGDNTTTNAASTSSNTNLRAFRCTLKTNAAAPTLSGKTILFHYSAIDGSGSGVKPVASAVSLTGLPVVLGRKFIDITNACPSTPVAQTVATTVTPAGSAQYNCNIGTTTETRTPTVGASDVEPALFSGDNAVAAFGDVTQSDLDALEVKPGRAVIFGVHGNSALWLELQKRQGIVPTTATAPIMPFITTVNATTNALTNSANPLFTSEAMRPNITKAEYRSIVQGGATDLKTINGTLTPVAGTTNPVPFALARRQSGSGTQAMSNVFFLNNGCGVLGGAALTPAAAYFVNASGYQVQEGSATSDVVFQFQSKSFPAIGVISLETASRGDYNLFAVNGNTDTTLKNAYAPLKLDGVSPTRANVINGSYEYFGEETIQWNKNVITSGSLEDTFMNQFVNSAAAISTLITLASQTQLGSAALSSYNGLPSTNTTWIMNSSRGGNNCAPATKIIE